MAVVDGTEGFGEAVDRIHAGQFAGGDPRGVDGPIFAADFIAGGVGVFPRQGDRADLVLNQLGIEFH